MEVTAQEVAEWMVEEIRFTGNLYQAAAIEYVKANFGEQFVFVNENGNASLSKEVKKAFRKLHGGRIAWDRDGFLWAWT
jgi:Fe-S cluster assembly iron-binding protein IscA